MPIRLRLALAFALAAAALFALGGWLFASGLSSAQLKTIDSQLTAQLAQTGRSLPAGGYLTQVIDPAGRVRSASADAGNVALVTAGQLSQARRGRIFVTRTMDEENTRIAAAPLVGRPGWVTVAAGSLETYDATQSQVARELAVGGAVFTAVAGLGAYWLARAALSPVERLRRQVAAISERGGAPGAGVAAVEVPATRDEVAALAGTMNDLLGRLQRALARQRAFAADAGHELRNPLAVLRGELELAARPGRGLPELTAAVRSAGRKPNGCPGSPMTCCCWPGATRTGSASGWSGRISGPCSQAAPDSPVPAWPRPASAAASMFRPGPAPTSTRTGSARRWTTCSATRCGSLPAARSSSSRRGPPVPTWTSRYPTTGRVSRPASCRARSSASPARTAAGRAATAGPAWAWPSSGPSLPRTAGSR